MKTSILPPPSSSQPKQPIVVPIHHPPIVTERFSPLVLPGQLVTLPQTYGYRLPLFYGIPRITTQQHIDKIVDFIDLEEVDEDDAKMRLMAQSFSGDVKKGFCGLTTRSIDTPKRLNEFFLARWWEKKNPLRILVKYNTWKRNPNETIQEFTIRFN